MKFKIKTSTFAYHLDKVSKAISNKISNSSLSGVKIEVDGKKIILTASNGETLIQSEITNVNVEDNSEPSVALVSGKHLVEIVRKTTDEFIEIETTQKQNVIVSSKRSNYKLTQLALEQFPIRRKEEYPVETVLNFLDFRNLIKKVIACVSTSESRLILQGVNLKAQNKKLIAVATDSYRLAKNSIDIEDDKAINVTIPAPSLNELLKIFEESTIKIQLSKTKVLFKFGSFEFETRLIEGEFPNVEKVIPTSYFTSLALNRQELNSALDRASIMLDNSLSTVIKMEINEDLGIILSTVETELGQAVENIKALEMDNKVSYNIAFNSKYLSDALKTYESDKIILNLNEKNTAPVIITDEKDTNLLQLILPINITR